MSKEDRESFEFLGLPYQKRLLAQFITDTKFANNIMEIIDPNYFSDQYLRIIAAEIKEAYEVNECVPDIDSLTFRLNERPGNKVTKAFITAQLEEIKNTTLNDSEKVQDMAMKFCKQQELRKSISEINDIIDKGNLDDYDKCEEILKRALEVGHDKDDGIDVFYDLDTVLAEDFRDPIPTGIVGLDAKMNGGLSRGELAVVLAPFGVGKAQPLTSKILTPNGWSTMGDIQVGDDVISRDGKSTKVTGVYPQGIRPIYKVSFNDGTSTLCDEEHLWSVNSINQRYRKTKKNGKVVYLESDNTYRVMKTKDMINNVKVWGGRRLNYRVPIIKPVDFIEKDLLIDPYLLGVILGDGCITKSNHPHIVTKDIEIVNEIINRYDGFVNIIEQNRDVEIEENGELVLINRSLTKISLIKIKDKLINLELYGCDSTNKFIPNDYLFNSTKNRLLLLQGLIDTDGYVDGHRVEYTTISEELSNGVKELVLSLGGKVSIGNKIGSYKDKKGNKITCKKVYRLSISFTDNDIIPCLLERKVNNFKPRTKYSDNKFISSIEYYGEEEAKCIMVDNPEHLYVTDDYIVTHNTTFITKVANEAYNQQLNVLQIFFEDTPKIIQRKHIACWSGMEINVLGDKAHRASIDKMVDEIKADNKGYLKLKKFPSDGTTMVHIRQYVRKLTAQGRKPDIILVDYMDCVTPSKGSKDQTEWNAEGTIMRQFETLLSEFNMAGWTAIQGNRSSIAAETVDSSMIGGAIKKGQIAHFLLSIAKTNEQKETGRANMAILKSRFGLDGIIYEDILFDNARIQINVDVDNFQTIMQKENNKSAAELDRVRGLMDELNAEKHQIRLRENNGLTETPKNEE